MLFAIQAAVCLQALANQHTSKQQLQLDTLLHQFHIVFQEPTQLPLKGRYV